MKSSEPEELVQLRNFVWPVPEAGYGWIRGYPVSTPSKPGRFLVANSVAEHQPAQLPGALFREFADTEQTPEGVLGFANTHGWLGIPSLISETKIAAAEGQPCRVCEDLQDWIREIRAMYRLVRLWVGISGERPRASERESKFKQRILLNSGIYEWETETEKGKERIPVGLAPNKMQKEFQSNPLSLLPFYLQVALNAQLAKHKVDVCLLWDSRCRSLGLGMVPKSLIGFLWLQFADGVQGGVRFRQCEDCKRWFAYGKQSARSDKRFCTGTCKARSHRAKRGLARA